MFLDFGIQHAMLMPHNVIWRRAGSYTIFFHLAPSTARFPGQKGLRTKKLVLIFSTNFDWIISYSRKNRARYRGADKSLARPGRKQARKHVRDGRDFNNIETRAVIKPPPLQGKAPKEIHAILRETLACFLPGRAKNLTSPLYYHSCISVFT